MLPDELRQLLPAVPPAADERILGYHTAREFHREVDYRDRFARHCQWYRQVAAQHQQELQSMRGDINILGWFRRGS